MLFWARKGTTSRCTTFLLTNPGSRKGRGATPVSGFLALLPHQAFVVYSCVTPPPDVRRPIYPEILGLASRIDKRKYSHTLTHKRACAAGKTAGSYKGSSSTRELQQGTRLNSELNLSLHLLSCCFYPVQYIHHQTGTCTIAPSSFCAFMII